MDSGTGTIRRQEYYSPIIDTESLLFYLLKQGKWGLKTHSAYTSQEMVVALPEGKENAREHSCDTFGGCENCGDCCATCGGKSGTGGANDDGHDSAIIDSSSSLSSTTLTPCTSTNTITSATFNSNKEDKKRDTELVFQTRKSFRKSSLQCTTITAGNNHKKLHRALTTANACSVNISSIMAQSQQSLSSASSPLLRQQRNSVMSSSSSLSSENSSSSSSKTRRKIVSRLAKRLREECDKILGSSESLLIDWRMLSAALKEISKEEGRFGVEDGSVSKDDAKYQDLVMFLADLFKYTPTLCITYTAESKPESGELTSTIDLRRFHNVKFLELKKVSPRTISNLKMIKRSLTTLKCGRCIETIGQILTEPLMTEAGSSITADKKLSCIWPELKDLDLSSNQIDAIDGSAVEAFDLCPLVSTLNLSRNRISSIDDSFARTLNSLSIINLTYNQLKAIPPIPPNVKVLILAHNYITSLSNNQNNNRNLETFISQVGPYRNLEILDLSSNLIASDSSFRVLRDISTLKHISLDGNPISYLESYRNNVLSYLNKLAISRHFTLDKKRLSSTEVKYAIEQSKKCKYVPQFSSMTSPHSHQPMSTSLLMTTSSQTISSTSRPSPLSHLTSLTQSFESNSSSLRSSRRKKPKIREISSIDFNESYNENVSPSGGEDNESIIRVPLERPGSSLSEHERRSILADSGLEQTCATIKALRNKYGADNWLLHQHPGRSEISKIICIPENKPFMEYNPSKSLPSHPERRNTGRRNSCSRCEGFNSNTNNSDSNEKNSSDGISVVASHNNSSVEGSDIGSYSDVYSTNFTSKLHSSGGIRSHQSSSALADGSGANLNEKGGDSNATSTATTREEVQTKNSIFDMNTDYMEEKFPEQSDNSSYFRIFMHGQYHNLICFNGFLFEVDPEDSTIYHKWDLNSLISLEEEKCDSETETVEFRLIFNTMRKQMREKSFIMCAKEFAQFDKLVSPYIEKKMMEEFIEALQCTRCHAQFSKAMASKTVKHEKGQAPREVLVCPDPACGNEFLVTLDTIPLPNNECLELDRGSLENSIPVPLRTSTPSVEKTISRSVPRDRSPPIFEAIKNFASSLTTRKSIVGNPLPHPVIQQVDSLEDKSDCVSDAKTASSSDTVMNTKSDSDIEVLSYESSSIEVLNKCGDSESDEVEVPEAEEVPVPEYQASKCGNKGPMSESTSSGSCAESIVTQYERKFQLQPISQPFSSPNISLSLSSTSSAGTSISSFASNSTLTAGSSLTSTQKAAIISSTIPVRYDFVDFNKIDHRLQLWSELSVFKSVDERLLALVKCLIITETSNVLGLVIFSSTKIYLYKISGTEGDKPQEWLTKMNTYDISKFSRLDVLIGRHGVGVDLNGKYFSMIFRDSERTSSFLEFFMCEICGELDTPPMVRDLSQTQKALMCPTSQLAYFGIVRFAVCDIDHSYPVSAIVLTQEDIILVTDISWMAVKANEKVLVKHIKPFASLRQIESLESDPTLVRLIYDTTKWELLFETDHEKQTFMSSLKNDLTTDVPTITVCSPIDA